ncbi:uncharacterized protein LOC127790713 [Diospyros lotus]|uniref:uncharacterized protein LOC127790713 n=1 Tax=Diospyros lotus TaxID=55363 RepID=UPI0022565DB8|nr:uncharacterized protein LOC127790713 [Diospyros lotus]
MALLFSLSGVSPCLRQHQLLALPSPRATHSTPPPLFHNRRFFPSFASNPSACLGRSPAASPGRPPPPPPESDPPTGNHPSPSAGSSATFQDTVRIFFAVLFWMSLFFWSSIWDGRNNGRRGKGSRFRR